MKEIKIISGTFLVVYKLGIDSQMYHVGKVEKSRDDITSVFATSLIKSKERSDEYKIREINWLKDCSRERLQRQSKKKKT